MPQDKKGKSGTGKQGEKAGASKANPGGKASGPASGKQPEKNLAPPPGGFSIEAEMAKMGRLMSGQNFADAADVQSFLDGVLAGGFVPDAPPLTPADQAQEIIYQAWETTGVKRSKLAKQALKLWPDCADAYVILAREAERRPLEAVVLWREGVEAGERALGPDFFEECQGHFWGILESRPYMRARQGLAETLWELGKHGEAVQHLREMLRLNPGDNQGIRYLLASCLLMMDSDEELQKLLDDYGDEPTAFWEYTRALLAFRREGDTVGCRKLLKGAIERNPYVPLYLLGEKKLPMTRPRTVGFGDESEAVEYAQDTMVGWTLTPGALDWLRKSGKPGPA